jgi:hypothetical protein
VNLPRYEFKAMEIIELWKRNGSYGEFWCSQVPAVLRKYRIIDEYLAG